MTINKPDFTNCEINTSNREVKPNFSNNNEYNLYCYI